MEPILKRLTAASLGSIVVKGVNMALMLGVGYFLARILGADDFGKYTLAFSIVLVLKFVAMLGLPNLAIREVAVLKSINDYKKLKGFLKLSYSLLLLTSLLIIGVIAILYYFQLVNHTLLLASFSLPFIALIALNASSLRGLEKIIVSQIPEQVLKPGLFLTLILLLIFWEIPVSLTLAVKFQVVALIVAFLYGFVLVFNNTKKDFRNVQPVSHNKQWMKMALPFTAMGSLAIINSEFDILMLGALLDTESVGVYKVIHTLSKVMFFVTLAVNQSLAPTIARMYAKGEKKDLQKLLVLASRAVVIIVFPLLFAYLFYGREILVLLFGDEYVSGALALSIAAIGMFYNAATGPAAPILNMTGNEKLTLRGTILVSLLNIILNPPLIMKFGVAGAAFTTAICPIIANTYWIYIVRKRLGLKCLPFDKL